MASPGAPWTLANARAAAGSASLRFSTKIGRPRLPWRGMRLRGAGKAAGIGAGEPYLAGTFHRVKGEGGGDRDPGPPGYGLRSRVIRVTGAHAEHISEAALHHDLAGPGRAALDQPRLVRSKPAPGRALAASTMTADEGRARRRTGEARGYGPVRDRFDCRARASAHQPRARASRCAGRHRPPRPVPPVTGPGRAGKAGWSPRAGRSPRASVAVAAAITSSTSPAWAGWRRTSRAARRADEQHTAHRSSPPDQPGGRWRRRSAWSPPRTSSSRIEISRSAVAAIRESWHVTMTSVRPAERRSLEQPQARPGWRRCRGYRWARRPAPRPASIDQRAGDRHPPAAARCRQRRTAGRQPGRPSPVRSSRPMACRRAARGEHPAKQRGQLHVLGGGQLAPSTWKAWNTEP